MLDPWSVRFMFSLLPVERLERANWLSTLSAPSLAEVSAPKGYTPLGLRNADPAAIRENSEEGRVRTGARPRETRSIPLLIKF